jgi:hypothetical protein
MRPAAPAAVAMPAVCALRASPMPKSTIRRGTWQEQALKFIDQVKFCLKAPDTIFIFKVGGTTHGT